MRGHVICGFRGLNYLTCDDINIVECGGYLMLL